MGTRENGSLDTGGGKEREGRESVHHDVGFVS